MMTTECATGLICEGTKFKCFSLFFIDFAVHLTLFLMICKGGSLSNRKLGHCAPGGDDAHEDDAHENEGGYHSGSVPPGHHGGRSSGVCEDEFEWNGHHYKMHLGKVEEWDGHRITDTLYCIAEDKALPQGAPCISDFECWSLHCDGGSAQQYFFVSFSH